MSGTRLAGSYATLLNRPGVARTFAPALVGRLTYGVLPLSLLFTVQHATESFSTAATAMALSGLASLSMPIKSRAIDRHGQRLVLPAIAAAMVAALVVAATMARLGVSTSLPWLVVGFAIGLTSPPLGPSMRAQWRALVPKDEIARAYSLDAVSEETLFLTGPVIAAGILALAPAYVGLLICATLVVVGALGLAVSPAACAGMQLGQQRMAGGPLRHYAFVRLVITMGAVGAVTATIYTATAARALAAGQPSWAGLADACVAVGSVAGGLLWGRLEPAWTARQSLGRLLAFVGAAAAIAGAASQFVLFTLALAVGGLAIAPIYVVAYQASDRLVAATEVTEASTWVTTGTNLGVTFGGAGSGLLVGHFGARAPSWTGAALALVLAGTILLAPRRDAGDPR